MSSVSSSTLDDLINYGVCVYACVHCPFLSTICCCRCFFFCHHLPPPVCACFLLIFFIFTTQFDLQGARIIMREFKKFDMVSNPQKQRKRVDKVRSAYQWLAACSRHKSERYTHKIKGTQNREWRTQDECETKQ